MLHFLRSWSRITQVRANNLLLQARPIVTRAIDTTNQEEIGQLGGVISCEEKGWREPLMDGAGLTDCGSQETLMHCSTTCISEGVKAL